MGTMFKTSIYVVCCLSLISLSSCSDDNENDNNGDGGNTTTLVNPSKVFEGGVPKSVAGISISQNEEGLVTSITTEDGKAVFEYFFANTKAYVAKNQARITVTDTEGDVTELNLQLNSDGYVEFCNSIDHAGTSDADEFTWEMEYDAEGHLIVMKRSEGGGEITNITYNKDGDVVKTSTRYVGRGDLNGDGIINSQDEWEYFATIDYTTDKITTPIENKGCLMLFDETLDVDMDEMIYAYYAGMLGKATKHLPLVQCAYDNTGSVSVLNFEWTLNSNGYPTELVTKGQWDEEKYTFTW